MLGENKKIRITKQINLLNDNFLQIDHKKKEEKTQQNKNKI